MFIQTLWLWVRSRPALQAFTERDQSLETQAN